MLVAWNKRLVLFFSCTFSFSASFAVKKKEEFDSDEVKAYNCIALNFNTQNYIHLEISDSDLILKFLTFRAFQPRYSYTVYSC